MSVKLLADNLQIAFFISRQAHTCLKAWKMCASTRFTSKVRGIARWLVETLFIHTSELRHHETCGILSDDKEQELEKKKIRQHSGSRAISKRR
jgi:hypothetical protein